MPKQSLLDIHFSSNHPKHSALSHLQSGVSEGGERPVALIQIHEQRSRKQQRHKKKDTKNDVPVKAIEENDISENNVAVFYFGGGYSIFERVF